MDERKVKLSVDFFDSSLSTLLCQQGFAALALFFNRTGKINLTFPAPIMVVK